MMQRRLKSFSKLFGCATALILLTSCGADQGEWRVLGETQQGVAGPSQNASSFLVQTMAVRPAYSTLVVGHTSQFTTDVWLENGQMIGGATDQFSPSESPESNTPQTLTWTTDNFGIATVNESGVVTAMSSGQTLIRVHCNNQEAVARIVVESSDSQDPNIDIGPPVP